MTTKIESLSLNRQHLSDIFNSALRAVDPYNAVKRALKLSGNTLSADGSSYELKGYDRIVVVGAGKGTAPMALAVEEILSDRLHEGIIVVKYGHTRPLKRIRQLEASHPLPDEAGVKGTSRIMDMLKEADERTLVICLLSGGGSALMVSPADGLTLKDKQVVTDLLLRSGAAINEVNTVRKHISRIKGGKLARLAHPATVVTMMLSDVIGDKLDVIASGPTVPDSSTYADALEVIERYSLKGSIPEHVMNVLKKGAAGNIPETPKSGEDCFKMTNNIIVGSLSHAIAAAREKAISIGFDTDIITDKIQGDDVEAAGYLAGLAVEEKKSLKSGQFKCLLSGGETTVRVKGKGLGGRNQELALAFALKIKGEAGIMMLSAGTDGTDGPTDAAGAIVNGETASLSEKHGLEIAEYLENNDSYNFFKNLDILSDGRSHLITGPTGTNVMDMQIITLEG